MITEQQQHPFTSMDKKSEWVPVKNIPLDPKFVYVEKFFSNVFHSVFSQCQINMWCQTEEQEKES